uniref:VPS9 domain-containing protein n=1 Tax=Anopheles atroparvus TaxID=41427 RepID=A0AAG5D5T3_ANOAO
MKWCRRWSHVRYVNRNEVAVINCIFVDGAPPPPASARYEHGSRDVDLTRQQQQPDTGGRTPEQRARLRASCKPSVNSHHHGLTINGIVAVPSTPSLRHEGECRAAVDLASSADKVPVVDPVGLRAHLDECSDGLQSQTRATRKRPAPPEDVKPKGSPQEQQQSCRPRLDRLLDSFRVQDGLPVPVPVCPEYCTGQAGKLTSATTPPSGHQTTHANAQGLSGADGNLVCSCCLLLDQGWYRVEYGDCEPPQLSADCLIMVEDLAQEQNSPESSRPVADVEQLFGLDEQGNIIINLGHIEEQRGRALLVKRRYRKMFSRLDHAQEINETTRFDGMWQMLVHKLFGCCEDIVIPGHPRNRTSHNGPGESIATYAFYLANKQDSTFSRNISNFIACTKESKAAPHPQVVMRNMRQFMSGMKNYLVKHGEGEFASEVQKARAQLKADEFLNLDAILEEVMHRLVILPLREHLYGLFVDYYSQSGDILLIVEKVRTTAGRGPAAFGIKNNVIPPSPTAMRQIATLFVRLQEAELPLAKLDLLLAAVSTIFEATTCCNGQQLSADDFLPVLVMVVAHCGFVGAEIEAEYMWGLLQPSLLSGEAGYYLTALCSAVHVLKNFTLSEQEGTSTLDWDSSTMPNCSSVLRVIIPDEYNGSIQTRTLPIRPHTTTKEICRIIAHKARITNAQDYGLFKLIDGEETLLHDTECPQDVRMAAKGKHFMIAYKRIDAKIAWPTVMPNNTATNTATTTKTAITTANTTTTTTTTTNTTNASDNQLKV